MNANFAAELESRNAGGDAPCLVLPDGPTQTYASVFRDARRIAALLAASGCRPGDRVAVQVDKHPAVLALYLGTLMVGGVYLPLNTAYRRHELGYFLADATPRIVVCAPERREEIEAIAAGATLLTLDADGGTLVAQSAHHDDSFECMTRWPDDLASILYTSGTTGRSKGAMITHGNLASNAAALVEAWGFGPDDVLLHALPIYHIHGLFVAIHCALFSGARMLWLPRFDAGEVIAKLPEATVMMGVPTFYTRMLAHGELSPHACRRIRLFVSGSAPLLAETFREFERRTGHRILERYGMTETGMNCSNPLHGDRVPGSVGPPLPGVQIRIRDQHGAVAGDGIGSIELRGPNVCRGYWHKPEATAESFTPDGWFITGDMGSIDARGYVSIVGRAKDMVISGGLNIYPIEIEQVLDALDGVEESAVVGVPDADFGEALVAFVVPRKGRVLTERGIISTLKAAIAGYKVPRRIVIVPELPRNAMGKVVKARLREELSASR